jgi:hypothetical protein
MKKIELLFYKTNPSEKNTGLKHVLWEIVDESGNKTYDWGFCEWSGMAWGDIEVPEGYTAQVFAWANTVNPDLLTVEKRIITR